MKKIIFSIFFVSLFIFHISVAKADVSINTYDEKTREFIKKFFPTETEDGILTDNELINMYRLRVVDNDITTINIKNVDFIKEISIEYCSNLTDIIIDSSSLNKFDIDNANRVKTIDLAGCPNLTEFSSNGTNSLSSLLLPTSLKSLTLRASKALNNYDISSLIHLESLNLGDTWSSANNMQYDTINLGALSKLKYLYLSGLGLSNIDLSHNKDLIYVSLSSNKLTNLDLSQNIKLSSINASNNKLETITLPKGEALNYLDANSNNLSSVDMFLSH